MFEAKSEHALNGAVDSSNNGDDVLVGLGREFTKIDRKRRRARGLSDADDAALADAWWTVVRRIIDTPPATKEDQRMLAGVVAACVQDCELEEDLKRAVMALVRSVVG